MFGMIYLLLCFTIGYHTCRFAFPELSEITKKTFRGEEISLPGFFVCLPAWFLTGTLMMTWLTYLLGYCFQGQREPLFYANWIVMPMAILGSILFFYLEWRRRAGTERAKGILPAIWEKTPRTKGEWAFLLIVALLVTQMLFLTFFIKDGRLVVGFSVFSDFAPHLGMIRSFSYGNNFPTQYAHFAGEDIRYHFMFQFLTGNLEYLGLRLDFAFNLPSIFSLVGTFLLLYVLAVKLTGKRAAGYLAALFFAFRSSPSVFEYFGELLRKEGGFWAAVRAMGENFEFIGKTPNETWGLWNLNVYCNQRHFAFCLMALVLALLLFLPLLYEQTARMNQIVQKASYIKSKKEVIGQTWLQKGKCWLIQSFFTPEGWKIRDLRLAVCGGLLFGATTFFNGAVLIATLSVLFVLAIFSDRRLELLCMALITAGLSLLQSSFFVDGSLVSPSFYFGFLAEEKTWSGVISYIFRLTGILPIILIAVFLFIKGTERVVFLAFTVPFVMSFLLSLTIDVTVNHKNIMLSLMLLGIFAAGGLVRLFNDKGKTLKVVAVLLALILTATGIYDYRTVLVRNSPARALYYDLEDDLLHWVHENTTSEDIFLTANFYLNEVILGGAMLYFGWPYYAWSAGYDTYYREDMARRMYEASSVNELYGLVDQEKIRYIMVDYNNRTSQDYQLNEAVIDQAFEKVYESGVYERRILIYDTKLRKQ